MIEVDFLVAVNPHEIAFVKEGVRVKILTTLHPWCESNLGDSACKFVNAGIEFIVSPQIARVLVQDGAARLA